MMYQNPYSFAKSSNSCKEYWGPLSLTTFSGMPYLENMDLRAPMMLAEVVVMSLITFGYHEK